MDDLSAQCVRALEAICAARSAVEALATEAAIGDVDPRADAALARAVRALEQIDEVVIGAGDRLNDGADQERGIPELIAELAPDGMCALCGETSGLEIDHVGGCRDWDPAALSRTQRAEKYWSEYDAGVELRALCRSCNASDGATRQARDAGY